MLSFFICYLFVGRNTMVYTQCTLLYRSWIYHNKNPTVFTISHSQPFSILCFGLHPVFGWRIWLFFFFFFFLRSRGSRRLALFSNGPTTEQRVNPQKLWPIILPSVYFIHRSRFFLALSLPRVSAPPALGVLYPIKSRTCRYNAAIGTTQIKERELVPNFDFHTNFY